MINIRKSLLHLQQKLQRLPRARRYLRPLVRHGTPEKVANILLIETEMRLRKTVLRGRPYYYNIDICNVCNLRCPLCPTGIKKLGRPQSAMNFDEYRRILNKVKRYALVISLYNNGEPFLNRDIFDIIEHTAGNNIATNISSNFLWPTSVDPKEIVRSGLEYITISLDGVSKETYEQYRVRGDFKEAVENLKSLLAARKALNSATPFVEWQFLVFKHNEHELARARELAVQWGVDLFRPASPIIVTPEMMHDKALREKWMPENPLYWERNPAVIEERGFLYDRTCYFLYRYMAISPGGGVSPCCFAFKKRDDFGNILDSSVDEIWNNKQYRSARMLFSKRPRLEKRVGVICNTCEIFKKEN